jgi:polyferredoxin
VDVLRWPIIGRLLRWRHARTTLQILLLLAALVVVLHGLLGPSIASSNLATVLIWVHYRGLLVVGLLAAGNLFCTGCPFVRTRDWGRRLHAPTWHWPKRLRGKWIAIVLFVAVLFCYELFDLWSLPKGTAYLVLGYFAAAMVVDLLFTGATFCKHLCPIGQFNFLSSVMSPLELRVREPATCQACRTEDCIAGRRSPVAPHRIVQRGCELGLFLPAKVGNLDCTLCLDCVQACPHDNIALATRAPALELLDTRRRAGIGRLNDRPDIAALVLVFVFGAMMNAFGMVAPVHGVELWLSDLFGGASEPVVLGSLFVFALGVMPAALLGGAAAASRALAGGEPASLAGTAIRYSYGLVPFGFGMWLAHYAFHLLTGLFVIVPVVQSAAIDATGWMLLGEPLWRWAGMRPGHVFPIQLGTIVLGSIGSMALMQFIGERDSPDRPTRAAAPWILLVLLLCAAAIWVLYQPMEMRGLGFGA